MRILAMVAAYPPDRCVGSWLMTHALLRVLVAGGHHADVVLTAASGDPYVLDGVNVWPHTGKSDPFRFLQDADVLVAHAESAGRAVTLGEMWSVPVVRLAHNTSPTTESAVRRRAVALTVFNSAHMAASFGAEAGRSIVVRPPVDPTEYATTPGDHVTLINVTHDKGAEVFYNLAERIPDAKFLGVEGGYGTQIVGELPNVELLPHLPADRMRDEVYARTRILLMPSAHESWGRTGVEAMCSGIPVVASRVSGLEESLGPAGIFVALDDIDGWEQAVRRLLDGRRWRAASRRAKERAAGLAPGPDLALWCTEIERLAAQRARTRALVRN
jgi:hypothetical protein